MTSEEIVAEVAGVEILYSITWRSLRQMVGHHRSVLRGSGFKFEKILPYEAYPYPRRVNRRASQRAGELLVNIFEEKRDIDVVFLVDLSRSEEFGEPKKLESIAKIAAILANTARKLRDDFTLIGYADELIFLSGERGKNLPLLVVEAILEHEPIGRGIGGIDEAIELLPRLPSLVFFASDFLPPQNFADALAEIKTRHDCVPIVFRDRWETALPSGFGFLPVIDSESGEESVQWLSPATREKFRKEAMERRRELESVFAEIIDIEPIILSPRVNPIEVLDEYFISRSEQQ